MPQSNPVPLHEVTGASDYFSRVGEVVLEIEVARSPVEAVELLGKVALRMGAEVAIFVSFIPEAASLGSYRLLLACDPQWCAEYEGLAGCLNDPWLDYARRHSEPIRGSELETATAAQREVVKLAENFGFLSSVIVPVPSNVGLARVGVLCVGSSVPGYFESEGYVAFKVMARSVAMEFHDWWLARICEDLVATAHITDADRELLSLEAEGCSTKEIARRLATSGGSVDSRFQRINEKLGVPNRHAAARLAAEYGLIRQASRGPAAVAPR